MPSRKPSPWSHTSLEARGYRKCRYCWRHLVKINEHEEMHRMGVIGPDGKRTDRTLAEKHLWATRHQRVAGASPVRYPRTFVRISEVLAVLGRHGPDLTLAQDLKDAVAPEPEAQ